MADVMIKMVAPFPVPAEAFAQFMTTALMRPLADMVVFTAVRLIIPAVAAIAESGKAAFVHQPVVPVIASAVVSSLVSSLVSTALVASFRWHGRRNHRPKISALYRRLLPLRFRHRTHRPAALLAGLLPSPAGTVLFPSLGGEGRAQHERLNQNQNFGEIGERRACFSHLNILIEVRPPCGWSTRSAAQPFSQEPFHAAEEK